MRVRVLLAAATTACLSGTPAVPSAPDAPAAVRAELPGPQPGHEARSIPLLRPPFDGDFPATNGFDHDARPPGPGAGATLAFSGRRVQGTFGHRAWDWQLPLGTPVVAPADGVVHQAGAMRPFFCDLLGRQVVDQLAVRIQHVAPDGQVFETELHHLGEVGVALGDTVRAGQVVGRSGSSGCSSGPHLHLIVWSNVGGRRAPIDPFGWEATTDDPWASAPGGAPSTWLWKDAPHLFFIARRAADASDGLERVNLTELWFRGWRDDQNPANERVEVRTDARATHGVPVDLSGWKLELPRGDAWVIPDGTVIDEAHPLRVLVGDGEDARLDDAVLRHLPGADLFPDDGGVVRLIDANGRLVSLFGYGDSASVPMPGRAPAGPSCKEPSSGCVPMPIDGAVAHLAPSADGTRWLAVVGDPAVPVLVDPSLPQPVRVLAAVSGGSPAEPGAARPHWILDSLVVYDGAAADGRRTLFFLSPGLRPSEGFEVHISDALDVLDAGQGTLLLRRGAGEVHDVWAWRAGDAAPHAVTANRLDETDVHLSPDAQELVYQRNGQVHRASVEGGHDAVLWPSVGADGRVGWLGTQVVLLSGGQLLAQSGEVLLSGLSDGLLVSEPFGRAVLVRAADGTVELVTPDKRVRPVSLRGEDLGEIAFARAATGWSVAWTARFSNGAPRGLGVLFLPL